MTHTTVVPHQGHAIRYYEPHFDYLRIVLASVVMFGHDGIITWPPAGNLAVQVFFALSGWLIGRILLETDRSKIFDFYYNRALRIWAPYYLAIILLMAASLIKEPITEAWKEFFLYKATFVYNIFGPPQLATRNHEMPLDGTGNHFWSVNAEEQFYLLAPFILTILTRSFHLKALFWVIATLISYYYNLYPAIFFGVLAAIISKAWPPLINKKATRLLAAVLAAATFTALLIVPTAYSWIAPWLSVMLVITLSGEGQQTRTGEVLGGMSYPLYLNHWIGVFAANFMLTPLGLRESPIRQALACAISYTVAYVLYIVVDKTLKKHRERFRSRRVAVTITAVAYVVPLAGILAGLHYSGHI